MSSNVWPSSFSFKLGIAGARLQMGLVLIMGIANLFADGISMGMGDFLSSRAEMQFEKAERKREEWECDNYLEGEKLEMVEVYQTKGLSLEDSTTIVNIISKNKKVFVDFMMVDELGIMPADASESPVKNGSEKRSKWNILFLFLPNRAGHLCLLSDIWCYSSLGVSHCCWSCRGRPDFRSGFYLHDLYHYDWLHNVLSRYPDSK